MRRVGDSATTGEGRIGMVDAKGRGGERIARSCVCASAVIGAAEEVNIVQYDWPAPRRRVFCFFVLTRLLREEEERNDFFSFFPSLCDLSCEFFFEDHWTKIGILRITPSG